MALVKGSKTLILGAGGRLGQEICRTLAAVNGEESVVASDIKDQAGKHFDYCQFVALNVFAPNQIETVIRKYHIKEIYNLAALSPTYGVEEQEDIWEINLDGLLLVLETARRMKIQKVFWPSSITVFGANSPLIHAFQYGNRDAHTVYGIAKASGELWCQYYWQRFGLDVRCIRYPGLIGLFDSPKGDVLDYAMYAYRHAVENKPFTCYLSHDTRLPMLYMPDAVKAALDLMQVPRKRIRVRSGYNIQAMSFTPSELAGSIRRFYPRFNLLFRPDERQLIANHWPRVMDDSMAREDWGWNPKYDLDFMTEDILDNLARKGTLRD